MDFYQEDHVSQIWCHILSVTKHVDSGIPVDTFVFGLF